MSLPEPWIDQIFAKMTVIYGSAWLRMWEGVDTELLRSNWAHELRGMTYGAIEYGLEHLPANRPPTVIAFRDICNSRPGDERQQFVSLPAPKPDPERLKAELAKLKLVRNRIGVYVESKE